MSEIHRSNMGLVFCLAAAFLIAACGQGVDESHEEGKTSEAVEHDGEQAGEGDSPIYTGELILMEQTLDDIQDAYGVSQVASLLDAIPLERVARPEAAEGERKELTLGCIHVAAGGGEGLYVALDDCEADGHVLHGEFLLVGERSEEHESLSFSFTDVGVDDESVSGYLAISRSEDRRTISMEVEKGAYSFSFSGSIETGEVNVLSGEMEKVTPEESILVDADRLTWYPDDSLPHAGELSMAFDPAQEVELGELGTVEVSSLRLVFTENTPESCMALLYINDARFPVPIFLPCEQD